MKGTFTRREPWFTTRQPSESRYMWIIFQSIIYQSQKQRVFVIRIPDYVTIGSIFCLLKNKLSENHCKIESYLKIRNVRIVI